jgi:hypothetical protein
VVEAVTTTSPLVTTTFTPFPWYGLVTVAVVPEYFITTAFEKTVSFVFVAKPSSATVTPGDSSTITSALFWHDCVAIITMTVKTAK